jgi:hypothetical protein
VRRCDDATMQQVRRKVKKDKAAAGRKGRKRAPLRFQLQTRMQLVYAILDRLQRASWVGRCNECDV